MAKGNWIKKKRVWILVFLVVILFISRMEFLKLRYQKNEFANSITEAQGVKTFFGEKKVNDRNIHFFKVLKNVQNPLLVFVHGSPGSLQAYEDFLKDSEILAHFDMIAIDRPGFGYSDFGKMEPSLFVQAELLASVLKDFSKRKKILIGHSMGGPVITKTAMNFPELVDGLVMVAPSVSAKLEPPVWWRKMLDLPILRFFLPPAFRVCNQEIIPLEGELENIESDWKNLEIPITIIHGEEDDLVPVGNSDFVETMAINSTAVKINKIKGGNHFILWSEIPLIKKEIFELSKKINFEK